MNAVYPNMFSIRLFQDRNMNNAEDNAGNYFCDSDFDDSREQRPNYLLGHERMQAELLKLVGGCVIGV